MYSKEEASVVRQKFWTIFGKYMHPVTSACGEKINWINYKTGIKGISFKMNVDNNIVIIAIEISCKDHELQIQFFDLFIHLEKKFIELMGINFTFEKNYIDGYGKNLSRIYSSLNKINIYKESDWTSIISFLKKNITAFDTFWFDYKVAFDLLQ